MNKKTVTAIAASLILAVSAAGCSLSGEPTPTPEPQVINILGSYALIDGYTQYNSPDGGFSIQLPEGSTVNDSNTEDVTITVASAYANADMINIKKQPDLMAAQTQSEARAALNDPTLEITSFSLLEFDGQYKGYKCVCSNKENSDLKVIVSAYFHADGTAYIVRADINNGSDERNVNMVNTVVDTFISYL